MEFSENFESFTNKDANSTKVFLKFNNLKDDKLMVKVGISMVSEENAKENLNSFLSFIILSTLFFSQVFCFYKPE